MDARKIVADGSNYTEGRGGNAVEWVVIHYTGGEGDAVDNGRYFQGADRNASAHYFNDGESLVLSVPEGDTAWHAGNWPANQRSIGIETCSAGEDFSQAERDVLRDLVGDLMGRYGVGADHVIRHHDVADHFSGRFVDPHKDCPAPYVSGDPDGSKWAALHDYITGGGGTAPAPTPSGGIDEDGYWGSGTTRLAQRQAGTPEDGVVSSQSDYWRGANPGLTTGWEWVDQSRAQGSQLVGRVQQVLGLDVDYLFGHDLWQALERRYGFEPDGGLDAPSNTIRRFQHELNAGTFF